MTSGEILTSIHNWELIRGKSEIINSYFAQGNCFSYTLPAYAKVSTSLHVYPGIYNNNLYFFMIPSEYDNVAYADTFNLYTTACLVNISLGGENTITAAEAKARIKAWKTNYPVWVPAQVAGTYGIFEAFAIPIQDFEVDNVIVTLGLKVKASAAGGFEADLIVTNTIGKQVVYDDFAKPVPPFGTQSLQNDFYLLSANS